MSKQITQDQIVAYFKQEEAALLEQLSKVQAALAAVGGSTSASYAASAPSAAVASSAPAPVKGKPGPKPKGTKPAAAAPSTPGKRGAKPGRRAATYIPKESYEETNSLTEKIIYVLASLGKASVKQIVEFIKAKESVDDEGKLANNVSQYSSALKKKNVIKEVSKEGREYFLALA